MKIVSRICLFLLMSMALLQLPAQETSIQEIIKNKPNPPKLVNDYTATLTPDQQQALERKLVALDDSTFTQIAVVIVSSLDGMDVADAALELGRSWGVGNKKNNSGVVLLISKKDRKLNISPGYGLEGALTDVEASHIIQDVIVPRFKGDDYYRGINEGTDAIIKAVKEEYKTPRDRSKAGSGAGRIIILIIIIIIFLAISSGGGRGGSFMSRRGYRGFSGPTIWPTGGSSWGGGGWSGGGGSSGGFGGFGGGSFGGGGSSGSW